MHACHHFGAFLGGLPPEVWGVTLPDSSGASHKCWRGFDTDGPPKAKHHENNSVRTFLREILQRCCDSIAPMLGKALVCYRAHLGPSGPKSTKKMSENSFRRLLAQGSENSNTQSKTSYPWGHLDYICNFKTNKSVSVSVIFWKLIWKQFKSVSVISRECKCNPKGLRLHSWN